MTFPNAFRTSRPAEMTSGPIPSAGIAAILKFDMIFLKTIRDYGAKFIDDEIIVCFYLINFNDKTLL